MVNAPLVAKSGYLRKALRFSSDVALPMDFPGGSEAFEMAALFLYDSPLPPEPSTVLALWCAAGFLEMTEECSPGNLCERADLYLNRVVLQSWDGALVVLWSCRGTLRQWADKLLVVSRCVESLAFMACMEMLDPESIGRPWSREAAKDQWVKDLIALPFEFFRSIIESLRRQGMEEKYVSPLVVFYANKWVNSKKTDEHREEENTTLEGLLELLLTQGEKSRRVIPVGFFFAMLSKSLKLGLNEDSKRSLEEQIASLLHFAQIEDFLLPESGMELIESSLELKVMERIFSLHVSSKHEDFDAKSSPLNTHSMVAELWDRYLSLIAINPKLETAHFTNLIQVIPKMDREKHDHLYRAISTFMQEHPHLSSEQKVALCRYLDCQKLSQPMCIQAVQNESMPLRLVVQVLSVQQMQTYQAFKELSESFREMHFGDSSGSFPSSRSQPPQDQPQEFPELTEVDYESTSFRIRVLEEELMDLKRSLKRQNVFESSKRLDLRRTSFWLFGMDGKSGLKRRDSSDQCISCFTSISWSPQRKKVNMLLNTFKRITLIGRSSRNKKQKEAVHATKSRTAACKSIEKLKG
ncbi:hypothetical protein HPP92_009344 [Vanilla planifolia]|uniref:NPH3 domain-containing protein n=1 Tax=Vanilla planifolia TaxID=51239 RepID=A0A835RA46_VANPL|nr:hypothetical protein HPP92_009344 [Vanilla planifolia]